MSILLSARRNVADMLIAASGMYRQLTLSLFENRLIIYISHTPRPLIIHQDCEYIYVGRYSGEMMGILGARKVI